MIRWTSTFRRWNHLDETSETNWSWTPNSVQLVGQSPRTLQCSFQTLVLWTSFEHHPQSPIFASTVPHQARISRRCRLPRCRMNRGDRILQQQETTTHALMGCTDGIQPISFNRYRINLQWPHNTSSVNCLSNQTIFKGQAPPRDIPGNFLVFFSTTSWLSVSFSWSPTLSCSLNRYFDLFCRSYLISSHSGKKLQLDCLIIHIQARKHAKNR